MDEEELEKLAESVRETTFAVPEDFWPEGKTYKEIIAEGRRADYEKLCEEQKEEAE